MHPALDKTRRTPGHKLRMPEQRETLRSAAFTLIEMLVVIAIILILLGIGAAVGPGLIEQNERQQTRAFLTNAEMLLDEYLMLTDQEYVRITSIDRCRDPRSTAPDSLKRPINTAEFICATRGSQRMQKLYGSLHEDMVGHPDRYDKPSSGVSQEFRDHFLVNGRPLLFVDAWGNAMAYVDPRVDKQEKRNVNNDTRIDKDGNVVYDYKDAIDTSFNKLPRRERAYFASAGPDGKWGDHRQLVRRRDGANLSKGESRRARRAGDNMYSFED